MNVSPKHFILGLLVLIAIAGVIEFQYAKTHPSDETPAYHIHADVSVVVNGKRLPFTDFLLYQNPVGCEDTTVTNHSGEIEAHFHNGNDQVAHFHAPDVTWRQFWQARNVTITDTCLSLPTGEQWCNAPGAAWQMRVNGQGVSWNLDVKPADLDRVLLWYGPPATQANFDSFVSNDSCIYSGKCPERGTAPAELCGQKETP